VSIALGLHQVASVTVPPQQQQAPATSPQSLGYLTASALPGAAKTKEPDVEIRYSGVGAFWGMISGLPFLILGLIFTQVIVPIGIILFVIGGGIMLTSLVRMADNSVKLSLTRDGLKDHRNNMLIRWRDIRGVRIWLKTVNRSQTAAIMYVKVAHHDGDREIAINVHNLNWRPDDIAQHVQKRAFAALEEAASGPEATMAALLGEITADLDGGIPLTFAVNKLVKHGLEPTTATELVSLAAGCGLVQCGRCRLQYRGTVTNCGSCGEELIVVDDSVSKRQPPGHGAC
jgi:hypothetical protein